ncbi:MAG: hypothetical protein KGJ02_07670 [Verrucomicrobiota bacterium]|nr:hypothetical protein [Verrucomicrobiota bacterium]
MWSLIDQLVQQGVTDLFLMKNLFIEGAMLTEENKKDILDSFLKTIKSISDITYQKRAWIRGEPPGTDFDETVNNYSLDADGILEKYKEFQIIHNVIQNLVFGCAGIPTFPSALRAPYYK